MSFFYIKGKPIKNKIKGSFYMIVKHMKALEQHLSLTKSKHYFEPKYDTFNVPWG